MIISMQSHEEMSKMSCSLDNIFRRQSFSGYITQFNIWDFALEDFQVENMATCRSDNWGNIVQSKEEKFASSQGGYSKV